MIWFCYFCKKIVLFILGVAHEYAIFAKVGPKNGNLQGFQQKIFRTTGFQLKLLIPIESLNIFQWKPAKKNQSGCGLGVKFGQNYAQCCENSKETGIIIKVFFHILHGEYLLKQKVVVVKTFEWKFKTNIARNDTFEVCLGPNFYSVQVKIGKKVIIFRNFTLASLKATKLIII